MAGLGGMDEECRGAGGCQSGGDLARDVARLAHAADHHPALAGENDAASGGECFVNGLDQVQHCLRLDLQHLHRPLPEALIRDGRIGLGCR